MYSQLIYLHFGGRYTSFTQLEAEIHVLEYKCASNTSLFSLLFLHSRLPVTGYINPCSAEYVRLFFATAEDRRTLFITLFLNYIAQLLIY